VTESKQRSREYGPALSLKKLEENFWFFNIPARKRLGSLPFRYSGRIGKYLPGCWRAINREGVRTSIREGGTLMEYEDEDPQIRKDFERAIERAAVPALEMPVFHTPSCKKNFRALIDRR
jgi:hypothetical protein